MVAIGGSASAAWIGAADEASGVVMLSPERYDPLLLLLERAAAAAVRALSHKASAAPRAATAAADPRL